MCFFNVLVSGHAMRKCCAVGQADETEFQVTHGGIQVCFLEKVRLSVVRPFSGFEAV